MRIIKELWSIKELYDQKDNIDPRPQYQRSLVWDLNRKQYLIDSILRGYDLPKIYLKSSNQDGEYSFEVTDGQQRLNTILGFYLDEFVLPKDTVIDGVSYRGLAYSELPKQHQKTFKDFEINVSNIIESEPWELNDLFTRLQKGVSLLPVELRHAMMSEIKDAVQKLLKHKLFDSSRIEDRRFKRQDYLDHALAECYFVDKETNLLFTDIKAPTLYALYGELSDEKEEVKKLASKASDVLDIMRKMNDQFPGIFKNKWGFVDVFTIIYRNIKLFNNDALEEISNRLNDFEKLRKEYVSKSDLLLSPDLKLLHKRDLYNYIQAFNREGAFKQSVNKRYQILEKYLLK